MNTQKSNALIRAGESIAKNKGDVFLIAAILVMAAACFHLSLGELVR